MLHISRKRNYLVKYIFCLVLNYSAFMIISTAAWGAYYCRDFLLIDRCQLDRKVLTVTLYFALHEKSLVPFAVHHHFGNIQNDLMHRDVQLLALILYDVFWKSQIHNVISCNLAVVKGIDCYDVESQLIPDVFSKTWLISVGYSVYSIYLRPNCHVLANLHVQSDKQCVQLISMLQE